MEPRHARRTHRPDPISIPYQTRRCRRLLHVQGCHANLRLRRLRPRRQTLPRRQGAHLLLPILTVQRWLRSRAKRDRPALPGVPSRRVQLPTLARRGRRGQAGQRRDVVSHRADTRGGFDLASVWSDRARVRR